MNANAPASLRSDRQSDQIGKEAVSEKAAPNAEGMAREQTNRTQDAEDRVSNKSPGAAPEQMRSRETESQPIKTEDGTRGAAVGPGAEPIAQASTEAENDAPSKPSQPSKAPDNPAPSADKKPADEKSSKPPDFTNFSAGFFLPKMQSVEQREEYVRRIERDADIARKKAQDELFADMPIEPARKYRPLLADSILARCRTPPAKTQKLTERFCRKVSNPLSQGICSRKIGFAILLTTVATRRDWRG